MRIKKEMEVKLNDLGICRLSHSITVNPSLKNVAKVVAVDECIILLDYGNRWKSVPVNYVDEVNTETIEHDNQVVDL